MFYLKKAVRLFSILLSVAAVVSAADEPKYRLPAAEVPNRQDIEGRWSGSVDFVGWWINMWIDRRLQPQIRGAIQAAISKQEEYLNWTGQGVLLRLEIIRRYDGNTPLTAVGLLSNPAYAIGHGESAGEAWIQNRSTGTISAGVPEGWEIDKVMSGYLWVYRDAHGHLVKKGVPNGTLARLDREMTDSWPLMYSRYLQARANNLELWKRIADKAVQKIKDRAAKAAIETSLRQVDESKRRVTEINKRLEQALESEKRGDQILAFLRVMSTVLTASQLAQQAADQFGDAAAFRNATTASSVIQTAEQVQTDRVHYAATLRVQFDGSFADLQKFLAQLWHNVQPANPPGEVGSSFDIHKPALPFLP
jgi:hypothetical protein